MKLSDLSATGRAIDPRYPTNLAIVLLVLVVTVVGTVWRLFSGGTLLESVLGAIGAGLVVFLT